MPTAATNLQMQQLQLQQQQLQQQQMQLHLFWQNQIQEISSIDPDVEDFKTHQLPLARIKKIMKSEEDVKMISAEAPVMFAKACEMFILELTLRSWIHTEENKRRTLQRNDIAMAITKTDIFDFLIDIVPRDDIKPAKKVMPTDPSAYYYSIQQAQAGAGGGVPAGGQGGGMMDLAMYQQQQQQQIAAQAQHQQQLAMYMQQQQVQQQQPQQQGSWPSQQQQMQMQQLQQMTQQQQQYQQQPSQQQMGEEDPNAQDRGSAASVDV